MFILDVRSSLATLDSSRIDVNLIVNLLFDYLIKSIMLVELKIHAVANIASDANRSMILLKEKNGERILPILLSARRATMLSIRAGIPISSPLALSLPDAFHVMLTMFDVKITQVELQSIQDGTIFCNVVCEREGIEKRLDYCLAPDALVIASTAKCPIMVEEELLEAQYMRKVGANSFALNVTSLTRKMLEDALQHAVESESYELASKLRDEIAKRTPEEEQ